ncbi:unnamed protein product, partial [Didymodactylos carnosus]
MGAKRDFDFESFGREQVDQQKAEISKLEAELQLQKKRIVLYESTMPGSGQLADEHDTNNF